MTAITELLSLFNLITLGWLLGLWGLVTVLSAFLCFRITNKGIPYIRFQTLKMPRFEILLLFVLVLILTTVGLIALVAPPNNIDSMNYHMSRVVHWIQNKSVAFYPTNILTQLYLPPWAEFAIMHLQILSGGDRFANLVQWFSMIGSTLGASLIAKHLGANWCGQIFAAVISATIPMGLLEASSTQNDYVVTFWLVCCVVMTLSAVKETANWTHIVGTGASLGLAVLTKPTAYIFASPFVVWLVISRLKTRRWQSWKCIPIVVLISLAINLGHFTRNFDLFGSPLGPQEVVIDESTHGLLSVPLAISNTVRNISLHAGTPIAQVNAVTERSIRFLHRLLKVDINDERTTWAGEKFEVLRTTTNEDTAGNLAHLTLIAISIVPLILSKRIRQSGDVVIYSVALTAAFLLFNLCLKWKPYNSRLHLPLFVLWSPFIATVLYEALNRKFANSIAAVLIVLALPWVLYNRTRPLIAKSNIFNTSRVDQYFRSAPSLGEMYVRATDIVKSSNCLDVGISLGKNDWEYPFWVLLENHGTRVFRFQHIDVRNASAVKSHAVRDFTPCAVVGRGLRTHIR